MLSLVIGGARSGKSRFAQSLGATATRVVYIATARVEDAEMAARIAQHRQTRPGHWETVEEALEIGHAVERHSHCDLLLLDCLTLWLSNFCWEHRDMAEASIQAAALCEVARVAAASRASSHVVLVTNEVGCGLVPDSPVGRSFRDLQGWVNQEVARSADWVYHVVAGIPVAIKRPEASR
jgi:adenosylcobinamide kinase/adenosylcobinamide-phosphate guanylyltransferase